ncbi:hypothetical protein OIE52_43520 [Streptomyces canus]|uniref:hypothetical protein n=1 Tax=Streptomyces canus TaxID=58343 RepID=UPI0030DFBD98
MITGEIKGKVDRVRDAFRPGGISNSDEVPTRKNERTNRTGKPDPDLFFTEDRREPRRQGAEVVRQRPTLRTAGKKVTAGRPDAVGV